jgi:lysophospholipase L1-like esterase
VTLACTPPSGDTFPVGVTQAECVAKDSLSRTASCSFSVTVAGPPRLRGMRIMAFGDSLTFGSTLLGSDPYAFVFPTETAYPTVLSQLLSARYTDQTLRVFNRGLVGEQAWRALSRFIAAFAADTPDVVVLLEGYNDFRVALDEGTTFGVDNASLGISQLAGEARRRGARVFICTLTPGRAGRVQIPASVLETMNDRFRQIARGEGAVLVDLYSALLPDLNANVSIDGLHLTPAGYRRVAETVFAAIRADLEVR